MNKKISIGIVGLLVLGLVFLAVPITVRASDPYVIYGVIRDENGNAVAGATVTGTNLRTNGVLTTTTASDGSYSVTFGGLGGEPYENGDKIKVVATYGDKRAETTTTVVADGRLGSSIDLVIKPVSVLPIPEEFVTPTAFCIYGVIIAVVIIIIIWVGWVYTGKRRAALKIGKVRVRRRR